MPNEPAPHPEHPYSWSVAHYVPRLVLHRGQTIKMRVMGGNKPLVAAHEATRDVLLQGVQVSTVPPDHVFDPSLKPAQILEPYYWPSPERVAIDAGHDVIVEVSGVPAGPIIVNAVAPADCLIAGFGLQVADLDAERRRQVDRIAQEASGSC